MDYIEIRRFLANCRFTDHARREMQNEPLGSIRTEEVVQALDTGEIIEEYPDDKPYPSVVFHKFLFRPFVVSLSNHERKRLKSFTLRLAQGERDM